MVWLSNFVIEFRGLKMSGLDIFLMLLVILLLFFNIKNRVDVIRVSKSLRRMVSEDSGSELYLLSKDPWISSLIESINLLLFKINKRREDIDLSYLEIENTLVNISHDLRTPLTSAKGYIEILLEKNIDSSNKEILEITHKRLTVLSKLIEQLFIYTKIHDERYKLVPKKINISSIIKETFLEHYSEFYSKNIELILNEDEGLFLDDVELFQDPKAIDHILYNVIQNVLRYGKSYLKISCFDKNNKIHLIFENDTDYNYDDVFKLKKSYVTGDDNRVEGSSGLGLSIIGFYLEKMDGNYDILYEEGIFTLKIEI